jgi:hypothetical protein
VVLTKKKKKKKKKKKTADRHAAVTADNRNRRVGWADSLASLGATVPPRPGAAGRAVRDAWAITTARTAEDEAGLECWGRYVRREGGGGKGKHALISRSRLRKIERESEAARNALADAAPAPTAHGSTFSFASSVPTVARPLPPAPSGRLTVAFACVHGMLPLLRECRADTVRALRLTRSLLVDHARKLGGVIARIELDAHMVVFREPMAAVAWMVECQVLCDRERIVVVVVSVVVVSVVAVVAAVFVVVKLCVF